ncbi:sensor histidine kinase [Patescibacteria group bacterium]
MRLFKKFPGIFVSERGQLVFATLLMVLIPAALVYNTLVTVQTAQDNMDIELQRKALLAEKIFQSTTKELLNDEKKLQRIATEVAAASEEVWAIDILKPKGEDFVVVASLSKNAIGETTDALNNSIAWHEEETIAYQTRSDTFSSVEQSQRGQGDRRFWQVVSPLYDSAGDKQALVSMKISSAVIDDLVRSSVTNAMIILGITIFVVVLLLFSNNRLFQYALLFRKLKEVDQMKDEFISMASHELRTPITGIRGYLEMVLSDSMGQLPPKAKEALKSVSSGAERLAELVEDLLNVSRIEQGRLKIEPANTAIGPIIEQVITELRPLADNKNLEFNYRPTEDLPLIYVDQDRFKQILINLAGNGLKYTERGHVNIMTEVIDNKVRIKFEDTGIGMSAKDTERLFTKFYRVQTDKTREISGTGLGLWITKQLTELMGGTIEVQSIEGTGSQFIVEFPTATKRKEKK